MSNFHVPVIENGSAVTLHFSLLLTNGEVIDSNFDQEPPSFKLGDGSMLPGFERLLLGLGTGDDIEEVLQPEQAFGAVNQGNLHRFPVAKFEQLLEDELIPTEVGSVVCFKDPKGFDLSGVVTDINDDSIGIDFNHPLAGKQIIFRARIISVIPASVDAIEIKL